MLFNSFTYLVFLPIVVALYWLLPQACRRGLLLVASYLFYMNWLPAYGLLILALTVVNYLIGRAIERFAGRKRAILTAGLVFNLGCLCFFKYAQMLVDSLWSATSWFTAYLHLPLSPASGSPALNILLPLGISFFTFEFIHYITDVYRGSAPIKNFWHFALFAAFFPSQIAGPIKRFQDFMRQLVDQPVFRSEMFKAGVYLIFLGLFKKIVLGDNIGAVVNAAYTHMDRVGTLDAWVATVGFQLQIFFDFAGYTDIGRGSALLFGYKVPANFNWPFLAANLTEFWRRWHMSLSTWLRDYLYIPLGGNKVGPWRMRWNTFITMVLGGLWHGAAWHYVIWGAFHGAGLVLSKEWQDFINRLPANRFPSLVRLKASPLWHWSGVASVWLFLIMAGILFRADGLPQAFAMAGKLVTAAPSGEVTQLFLTSTLPVTLAIYSIFLVFCYLSDAGAGGTTRLPSVFSAASDFWRDSIPAQIFSYAALTIVIFGFAPGHVAPFIYFQF